MNITINLGRLGGKMIMGSIALILFLVISFALTPMFIRDFSSDPFQLTTTEQGITLSAPMSKKQTIP